MSGRFSDCSAGVVGGKGVRQRPDIMGDDGEKTVWGKVVKGVDLVLNCWVCGWFGS